MLFQNTINEMQLEINRKHTLLSRSYDMRLKRLEDIVSNLADELFGSDKETPTGLGITTGTNFGKRFEV
jgi:hypothetical protein